MSELADMVERDYVRVDSEDNPGYVRRQRYIDMKAERDELQRQLDTMRDVTREFRDERDEWKAKAKKRDFKDEMADLLFRIQIPLNVQREYLKKVSQDSEMDSRERLEAEIRYEYNGSISYEADQIIEWLDRQAAITTQECNDVYGSGCEECRSSQKRKIAELQEQLDTMRDVAREFRDERDELKSKADALEADKASWQSGYHIDRLAKLQAQRDRYRELLSKAVEEAQGIVKLMEVDS